MCLPALQRAAVGERLGGGCSFGHRRPPLGGGRLSHDRPQHGAEYCDRWIAIDQVVVVEPLKPPIDRLETAPAIGDQRTGGDQASDLVGVAPGLGVGDRHLRKTVRLVPRGGAGMELGDDIGFALAQLDTKELLEQRVVAVPLAPAIEWHEQQVGALQRLQDSTRTCSVHDGVAKGTAHAFEHRRSGQEGHPATRDARQQLRAQVVGHQAVVPAEREPAGAASSSGLVSQRGEVQADRPPLGVPDELGHLRLRQPDSSAVEQQVRLPLVHRQIVDADLQDRTLGAQTRQGDRRDAPGRDHELPSGGNVDRELGDGITALVVVEQLRVVEDQDHRIDHPRHRGGDATGDRGGHRRARRRPRPEDVDVDRLDPIQRRRDVGQQDGWVVVLCLDRDPRHATRRVLGPLAQERRLAVAGRGRDRHNRNLG